MPVIQLHAGGGQFIFTARSHIEVVDTLYNRLRPSIPIGYEGRNVLVGATPDFRT